MLVWMSSHAIICPREYNYKQVWMERGKKKPKSLQRTRVADHLIYKKEEQKLIVHVNHG